MGQKVSPIGLRIGINKDWESKWYANKKDFSKYLNNDVKIRNYLEKRFANAGISKIVIERNPKRCEVIMYVSKPGLVIGQNGIEIENVKKDVSKLVKEDICKQLHIEEVNCIDEGWYRQEIQLTSVTCSQPTGCHQYSFHFLLITRILLQFLQSSYSSCLLFS